VENAVLVTQAIADRRQLHRRHRIQEAGGQAPQPAIAESRVGLLMEDLPPLAAVFAETPLDLGVEHEIHDVVAERAPNKELDRKIVDPLRVLARVSVIRLQPAAGKNVSHRAGRGLVALSRVRVRRLGEIVEPHAPLKERIRSPGEADVTDAVRLKERVSIRRTGFRLVENLRIELHRPAPVAGARSLGRSLTALYSARA
jgi:hypothetical protein